MATELVRLAQERYEFHLALGGETFALSIQAVKEILQYTSPTSVPMP